mmetsp:Transcript_130980/g.226822  ORF Transcript_130980/g.226822 Transcript_130980/m.226822 type:complete len:106 (-) Transcript_130980:109-426(-)
MKGFRGMHFLDVQSLWDIMITCSTVDDGTVDLPGFVMAVLRLSSESTTAEAIMMSMDVKNIMNRLDKVYATPVCRSEYRSESRPEYRSDASAASSTKRHPMTHSL